MRIKFVVHAQNEKLRTEQQERRAKNEYPHGISRKGYAQLAREKPQLLGKNRDINKVILWGEARKKLAEKHEKAVLKQLPEKLAKLGEYISQKTDGTLDPKDKNCTILQAVLGKPEHPGRLRGVGSDISPTMYYQVGREKDLLPQICQRQERQLMSQAKRIKKLEAVVFKDGSRDEDTVEKGSCSPNYADIGMVNSNVEELDKKAHLQGKMVA